MRKLREGCGLSKIDLADAYNPILLAQENYKKLARCELSWSDHTICMFRLNGHVRSLALAFKSLLLSERTCGLLNYPFALSHSYIIIFILFPR